jgi:hypothetical protein
MRANGIRIKQIHVNRQTHARAGCRLRGQKIQEFGSEISLVRTTKRGSFATEEKMLNTAPTTLEQRERRRQP